MEHTILSDTRILIDLDRIAGNMRAVKNMAGPQVTVAAVVKADANGHGAAAIAPTLMENGAGLLAVANLAEALELKKAYPQYPVFIMGLTPDRLLPLVVEYGIIQTVDTLHQAQVLSRLAGEQKKTAVIHIKYDTGFHRLGFPAVTKSLEEIRQICALPGIDAQGFYSHLALKDDASNKAQFTAFMEAADALKQMGCTFRFRHIADSISGVDDPEYRLDMIRTGALLYGLKGFHRGTLAIRQALTFRTRISHISHVKKGEGVSYDYVWTASQDTRVGTLPFGYADGYPRCLGNGKGVVLICGKRVPIIGVLCMDQCMVDLTGIPQARVGDEVIIYGNGSDAAPDIQEISQLAGTNKNEIAARLTRRPPRVYIHGDQCAEESRDKREASL